MPGRLSWEVSGLNLEILEALGGTSRPGLRREVIILSAGGTQLGGLGTEFGDPCSFGRELPARVAPGGHHFECGGAKLGGLGTQFGDPSLVIRHRE